MTIKEKYQQACQTPSDINELLPFLREYAAKCEHITEMGTRSVVSTYAFLDARPKKLICYDIARWPQVDEAESLAKAEGVEMVFKQESTLECEIEETDFLFIDTYHTFSQLSRELTRHANKTRKYIGFHDTQSFREVGEQNYPGIPSELSCGRGLWPAIQEFLNTYPHWQIDFETSINNGLTVLKRIQ